jgi:hypothetical protein
MAFTSIKGCFINGYTVNSITNDIYPKTDGSDYYVRILVDAISDVFCTQIQFLSYEKKNRDWNDDELLLAYNNVIDHIKNYVDKDITIEILKPNGFFSEQKKIQPNDLIKEEFLIEINEDKKNNKKIYSDLMRINETESKFNECKKMVNKVLDRHTFLVDNYGKIRSLISYLSDVSNTGVVTEPNNNRLRIINTTIYDLMERKDTQHYNYKANLKVAKDNIDLLDFPKFFSKDLPYNDINTILEELDKL